MTTPGMVPDSGNPGDLVPRPDPTTLTTAAVDRVTAQFQREVETLRELTAKDLEAAQVAWAARMDGTDTQRALLQDEIHSWPEKLEARLLERRREFENEVSNLREIIETRLDGNDEQRALLWAEIRDWGSQLEVRLERRRREFLDDLAGTRQLLEQRMDSMDKAVEVALADRERYVATLLGKYETLISANREYATAQLDIYVTQARERFTAIDGKFTASETSVAKAFAAAKEAVDQQNKANSAAIGVSEANTKEQLLSLSRVTDADIKALAGKVDDARDRIGAIESLTQGIEKAGEKGRGERTLQHGSAQLVVAGVAVFIAIVSAVVAIASLLHH